MKQFDFTGYLEQICRESVLCARDSFKFCKVTGLSGFEGVIQNFTERALFAVDDTAEGNLVKTNSGYLDTRFTTVFLIRKFEFKDMDDQRKSKEICVRIFYSIFQRLIHDRAMLERNHIYMDTSDTAYHEIPEYFCNGSTGIYFNITHTSPKEMCYNENEWDNKEHTKAFSRHFA